MKMRPLIPGLLAVGLSTGLPAVADTSTSADGYVVYHNAFTADTLDPAIARQYGIQRSRARGVLNVTVLKGEAGNLGAPTRAQVAVLAVSLAGREQPIRMREIREHEAVYYIGEFSVQDRETLRFRIEATPAGAATPLTAETSEQFFTR